MAELTDDTEALYSVPTHLDASGSVGKIPTRTFYVGLGAGMIALGTGYYGWLRGGLIGAVVGALLPLIIALPFALWFLSPPAEHGIGKWLAYRFGRKVLLTQHLKSLRGLRIEDGVIHTGPRACCAILRLPTINLDLASVASRRRHRRQIGLLLDAIRTHQVQILLRAETLPQTAALERMKLNRNPFAARLASWLAGHHTQQATIDRRRYMVIPAPDEAVLLDRVTERVKSLKQAGLEPERITDDAELRDLINGWWTWRPHPERFGPERVDVGARELQVDGEWVRVYALAKTPGTIATNWWDALVNGDLACDVSLTVYQRNLTAAKWSLDLRYNDLASSNPSPAREIAIEQVRSLRRGFEGRTRPWDMQILFVVRGHDRATLDRNTKRLEQQVEDLGAQIRVLRWEQTAGMEAASPLCLPMLPARPMYVESGTLARTTMFSASTLQMLDGVPWGLSGATPILLTTARAKTGRHFGWFGFTGAGKGFGVRCYLARRHFADRLRLFFWDADDVQHEYAGRFTTFLGGMRLELNSLADLDGLEIDPRWQVVAFDVSGMPRDEQPAAFARVKRLVEQHVLAFPGESAFVVDEATTLAYAPDQSGARALGEAVTQWRKRGIEVHVITQRVSDWFGTALGRQIQGNLAVKWYGAQEDSELYDVAAKVNLTTEERDRIGGAGIGQGLLVAFGRRVWSDLFDHVSPDEYSAYSTDPPERVEVLSTGRVA